MWRVLNRTKCVRIIEYRIKCTDYTYKNTRHACHRLIITIIVHYMIDMH